MRIAVASEGLEVAPVFGRCSSLTCYRVERGVIVECQNTPANPLLSASHLASLMRELDVRVLIAGTIERDAAEALRAADIEVIPNKDGTARHAAEDYLAHTLIGADEADEEEIGVMEA